MSDQPNIEFKDVRTAKDAHTAKVGEYVSFEQLIAAGGKFYQMGGESYCDTLLASFKLIGMIGFQRIE